MGKKGSRNKNIWTDHLTRKAKADNYPARSVYKLKEIQKKFRIMKKNSQVLDLGCAPGSWLLYAANQVGEKGRVLGIDLKKVDINLPSNVHAIQNNIWDLNEQSFLCEGLKLDVVLSDMAPATTGRKDVDALRSFELCNMALKTANKFLSAGGGFVCKIFQGNEFKEFEKKVSAEFKDCKIFKPGSCRKQSKEIYIIAKGKK
jgi:23S rRNA (uridine2552-2'-O)-methyltransferase